MKTSRNGPFWMHKAVPRAGLVLLLGVGSASVAHATNAALPWESGLTVFMNPLQARSLGSSLSWRSVCVAVFSRWGLS